MDRYKADSLRAYNEKWPYRYDSSRLVNFWVKRYDKEVISLLPENLNAWRALDVGCATGRLLLSLSRAGIASLAGFDIAPRIVEVAARRLHSHGVEADLKTGDAETALPWDDESFELVTLTGVFHHFLRPVDALKEIHRVLIVGGTAIIVDPWFPPLIRQICNCALRVKSHDGDCRFYSPRHVSSMLASRGFVHIFYKRAAIHSFLVGGKKG